MHTLRARFDPQRNSFDLLRLLFACTVALTSAVFLGYGWHPQMPHIGDATDRSAGVALGTLALNGFFVLSGFLVTRSLVTRKSLPRFAWHRFLRIVPGFWVCLIGTAFVLAPVAALLSGHGVLAVFTGEDTATGFVWRNAGLLMTQPEISGLLDANGAPANFGGALWSLSVQAVCYGLAATLGTLAVLHGRPRVLLIFAGLLAAATVAEELGMPIPLVGQVPLQLTYLFVLGMIGFRYAHRIRASGYVALLAAVVLVISTYAFRDHLAVGAAAFAYLVLWLGTSTSFPVRLRADLSYGTYLYHWPLLQLLVLAGLAAQSPVAYFGLGIVLTGALAVASWMLVERPSMRRRSGNPFGLRQPTRAPHPAKPFGARKPSRARHHLTPRHRVQSRT